MLMEKVKCVGVTLISAEVYPRPSGLSSLLRKTILQPQPKPILAPRRQERQEERDKRRQVRCRYQEKRRFRGRECREPSPHEEPLSRTRRSIWE